MSRPVLQPWLRLVVSLQVRTTCALICDAHTDANTNVNVVYLCVCSVYAGQQSVLISPMDLEVNPALWLQSVSQFKVRDTFCSYSVMELCTRSLSSLTDSLKVRTHTEFESASC